MRPTLCMPARNFPILAYLSSNVIKVRCHRDHARRQTSEGKAGRAFYAHRKHYGGNSFESGTMPLGVNAEEQNTSCANNGLLHALSMHGHGCMRSACTATHFVRSEDAAH